MKELEWYGNAYGQGNDHSSSTRLPTCWQKVKSINNEKAYLTADGQLGLFKRDKHDAPADKIPIDSA